MQDMTASSLNKPESRSSIVILISQGQHNSFRLLQAVPLPTQYLHQSRNTHSSITLHLSDILRQRNQNRTQIWHRLCQHWSLPSNLLFKPEFIYHYSCNYGPKVIRSENLLPMNMKNLILLKRLKLIYIQKTSLFFIYSSMSYNHVTTPKNKIWNTAITPKPSFKCIVV